MSIFIPWVIRFFDLILKSFWFYERVILWRGELQILGTSLLIIIRESEKLREELNACWIGGWQHLLSICKTLFFFIVMFNIGTKGFCIWELTKKSSNIKKCWLLLGLEYKELCTCDKCGTKRIYLNKREKRTTWHQKESPCP